MIRQRDRLEKKQKRELKPNVPDRRQPMPIALEKKLFLAEKKLSQIFR